jgi:hypothetical protein
VNHGSGSHYRLFEYNIVPHFHFDGYHGGTKYDTTFRNWMDGRGVTLPNLGYLIHNRYMRYHNVVGNILGRTGVAFGGHSLGNPNMGNSQNDGTTANSSLYVSSGGASGVLHRHLDASSYARIEGTVTSKVGTVVTITLGGGATFEADFRTATPGATSGGDQTWHLVWGSRSDEATMNYRKNMDIVRASSSGTTIVLDDSANVSGGTSPSSGTVWIHPGQSGNQEFDGAVEYTMFKKDNYAYAGGGAAGSIDTASGDTLPDSLAETGAPADWPTGVLAWPPAMSPSSPDTLTYAAIPAGFFVQNGYWPSSTSAPSGGSGTMTVTNTTATNITVP